LNKNKKFFNVNDFGKIKEVFCKPLNVTVKYGSLNLEDLRAVQKCADDVEKSFLIVTKMLSKADPAITIAKVKELPVMVIIPIIQSLVAAEHYDKYFKNFKAGNASDYAV
jgi:hypothetical protein